MPGSHIPIYAPKKLLQNLPDYIIIFPWNIRKEVENKYSHLKKQGVKFVTILPKIKNSMKNKIFYTKPSITELEISYANDAAKNGWGEHCYSYIEKFEQNFKDHLNVKYALATSSCTGAMHMGLKALGIKKNDEIILADTNWIATVSPVTYLGAKPVFVDILPNTWCIDPKAVEQAITPKTKAIIAVHLYGNLCEMDELFKISNKYNIPIIEDAAEAIGSVYKSRKAGSMGIFSTFSFHGTKTITTGEGGVFATNDSKLFDKVMTLSNHGRSNKEKKQFWSEVIGFKYKMSNIQAAIGCAQIERIDELVERKREIFSVYKKLIGNIPGISTNPEQNENINGFWMPTIVFDKNLGISREMLKKELNDNDIDARVFFWPLSSLPMFKSIKTNVNSWDLPERAINLPSYHDMTNKDIEFISNIIKKLI